MEDRKGDPTQKKKKTVDEVAQYICILEIVFLKFLLFKMCLFLLK